MSQNNLIRGYFAGIGSRNTPSDSLSILTQASQYIVYNHLLKLRSGHAVGADRACEIGADGFADIYLPWRNYGIKPYKNDLGMEVMGETILPLYKNLSKFIKIARFMCSLVGRTPFDEMNRGVQLLMLRNVNQIIGHSLSNIEISKMVLCYSHDIGGTSYAIMLARFLGVSVINIRNKEFSTIKTEINDTLFKSQVSSSKAIQLLKEIYE